MQSILSATKAEKQWRIRKGMDRRFRSGHPWVYSNELTTSPKEGGMSPGALVRLEDASGKFLAHGFGNPHSLIAFRELNRDEAESNPLSESSLLGILQRAGQVRAAVGLGSYSHRLCFGEADGLPGLVIDRYALIQGGQVFSIQAHTAGADSLISRLPGILERYVGNQGEWARTGIVLRNDVGVRKLEGLTEQEPEVVKVLPGMQFTDLQISIKSVLEDKPLTFHVDLLGGQKTGFFLDQFANIQIAAERFKNLPMGKHIRILDLCSYVGQWSTQLANVFQGLGKEVEIVAVDASAKALESAERNVKALKGKTTFKGLKLDVLKGLGALESGSYDIVISDPPAFIKGKKDIHPGTHAYLQLGTEAFRLTKTGGGVVCCSCSALLTEDSFTTVLSKAALRNKAKIRWVAKGSQSPDHPMLTEFPEGRYLKSWIGILL